MGFGSFTVAKYGTGCPGCSIVVPYSFSVVPYSCSRHNVPDVAAVKNPNPVMSLDCLVKYHLTYSTVDITKLNNVKLFKLFFF